MDSPAHVEANTAQKTKIAEPSSPNYRWFHFIDSHTQCKSTSQTGISNSTVTFASKMFKMADLHFAEYS